MKTNREVLIEKMNEGTKTKRHLFNKKTNTELCKELIEKYVLGLDIKSKTWFINNEKIPVEFSNGIDSEIADTFSELHRLDKSFLAQTYLRIKRSEIKCEIKKKYFSIIYTARVWNVETCKDWYDTKLEWKIYY